MNSNGVMISAGQVRVSDGLHLSYDHIDGYRPGVPSEALMNVTSLRTTGPVVTTTFAEGDHWGELVLDRDRNGVVPAAHHLPLNIPGGVTTFGGFGASSER